MSIVSRVVRSIFTNGMERTPPNPHSVASSGVSPADLLRVRNIWRGLRPVLIHSLLMVAMPLTLGSGRGPRKPPARPPKDVPPLHDTARMEFTPAQLAEIRGEKVQALEAPPIPGRETSAAATAFESPSTTAESTLGGRDPRGRVTQILSVSALDTETLALSVADKAVILGLGPQIIERVPDPAEGPRKKILPRGGTALSRPFLGRIPLEKLVAAGPELKLVITPSADHSRLLENRFPRLLVIGAAEIYPEPMIAGSILLIVGRLSYMLGSSYPVGEEAPEGGNMNLPLRHGAHFQVGSIVFRVEKDALIMTPEAHMYLESVR